jgi:hypothetical protein
VYSFGVVLWELLTWQEPWGPLNSYQIMIGLQDAARPPLPPLDELPGQARGRCSAAEGGGGARAPEGPAPGRRSRLGRGAPFEEP